MSCFLTGVSFFFFLASLYSFKDIVSEGDLFILFLDQEMALTSKKKY